jgi:putative cell wall-binding protein
MPIILSNSKELGKSSYDWLKNQNLKNAYIIGGETALSDTVLNQVNSITIMDISNNRIGGSNRYETNALVINKFRNDNLDALYLSKGLTLVDALTAAPIVANNNGFIILCNNNLTESQKSILSNIDIKNVIEVGGGISKDLIKEIEIITN